MAETVTTLRSVCADCGRTYEREQSNSRCPECAPPKAPTVARVMHDRSKRPRKIGYTAAWDRLSARARRLQPFCSDCGREDQLTADHSPAAWQRQAEGKPIRLEDIDVVCRRCNAERGPARGSDAIERPTIGTRRAELGELTEDMDDLDQRIARGETQGEVG